MSESKDNSMAETDESESLSDIDVNMDLALAFVRGMRDQDLSAMCDVTVEVQGQMFHCHRVFLSICSGFFRAMFNSGMKESQEKFVRLEGVSKKIFGIILTCIIDNKNVIESSNYIEVWKASDMLEMLVLKDQCESFAMSNICVTNCFDIYHTAKRLHEEDMIAFSWNFILNNFDDLIQSQRSQFLDLPFTQFKSLISDNRLKIKLENCVIQLIIDYIHNLSNDGANDNDAEESDSDQNESFHLDAFFQAETKLENTEVDQVHILDKLHSKQNRLCELLMCARLLLTSDKYLMSLLWTNTLLQDMPKVKNLIKECVQWKLETGLAYRSNISSVLSFERDHSEFENAFVYFRKTGFSINQDMFVTTFKMRSLPSFYAEVKGGVVTAVVHHDQIFIITEYGDLYSISLHEVSSIKLLQSGFVNQDEIYGDLGIVSVGYDLYVVGALLKSKDVHIGSCHIRMLPLEDPLLPVSDITLVPTATSILVFGSMDDDMKTTIVQCIDLETSNHYRLDDVEGSPTDLVPLQTRNNTFFLFQTGSLWKLEDIPETGRFRPKYLTILWNFNIQLQGAFIVREKLYIFSDTNDKKITKKLMVWHQPSVEGAFTSIKNVQRKGMTSSSDTITRSKYMTVRLTKAVCEELRSKK